MRPYVVRKAAARDIAGAYVFYERARAGLGEELLRAIDEGILAARRAPEAYPVLHRETRRVLLRRFPFGLFYRLMDGVVVVIACIHTRRDGAVWQRRR